MKVLDIRCNGSLSTSTYFRNENGDTIRVEVYLRTECTVSNQITYFRYNLYLRKYRCKKFNFIISSNHKIEEISKWINKQDLYTALHNHWDNLNPLKKFCTYHLNNKYVEFSVTPIEPSKPNEMRSLYATI
ncbi:MAG: hypothetical protein PHF86_00970 [Candidatus Nanoarchaeia archaeon]|nr:hypothetical protein [Candidatus Nanoarchaeia archaeon]